MRFVLLAAVTGLALAAALPWAEQSVHLVTEIRACVARQDDTLTACTKRLPARIG